MDVLAGVRVVEMGLWAAGPAAGGVLADWGADVVKIEPLTGDPMRGLFGALLASDERRCPPFDLLNRGKRSVALDVNTPEGRDLTERVIGDADVFLTNMRPAFLRRVGLDHERLLASHDRLVYAVLTGYGLDGPERDAPGYDLAAFGARGGVANRSTPRGEPPVTLAGGMGDVVTGMTMVSAILAALLHRERTGRGQLVSTSLLRSGAYCIGMELSTRAVVGRVVSPSARTAPNNPLFNSYQASDGKWFWLVGAEAQRHWPDVLAACADPRLDDERFGTARDRRKHAKALIVILDEVFARRTREEWAGVFAEHDVWWAPVNSADDLLTDPQAAAAGVWLDPAEENGDAPRVASPVDFGADRLTPDRTPGIGDHTDEILRGLDVSEAELDRLRDAGVIGSGALVTEGERS